MEKIEEEINEKLIEKDTDESPTAPAPPAPATGTGSAPAEKKKKERTPAQKAAFEKARQKRAENYQKRKALKEQTKIKEVTSLSQVDPEIIEDLRKSAVAPPTAPSVKRPQVSFAPPPPQDYAPLGGGAWHPQQAWQQPPQPVINNYYYGTTPGSPAVTEPKERKKKKKVIIPESSSEEESDEEVNNYNPFLKNKSKPQNKNNLLFKYT